LSIYGLFLPFRKPIFSFPSYKLIVCASVVGYVSSEIFAYLPAGWLVYIDSSLKILKFLKSLSENLVISTPIDSKYLANGFVSDKNLPPVLISFFFPNNLIRFSV